MLNVHNCFFFINNNLNLFISSFFLGVGSDLPIGQRSGNMAADVGAPPAWHPCLYCTHQTRQKHCDRWWGWGIYFCLLIIKTCNLLCLSQQRRGTPQSTTSAAPVDLATRVPWWVNVFSPDLVRCWLKVFRQDASPPPPFSSTMSLAAHIH